MLNKIIKLKIVIFTIFLVTGCGNSSSDKKSGTLLDSNNTDLVQTIKGYVIDSPVVNLPYTCDNKTFKTTTGGLFSCQSFPISFSLGNIKLGEITKLHKDRKVYIQDILQKDRNDFKDDDVLKMAILFQSMDNDGNFTKEILLPDEISLSSDKKFEDLSFNDINVLLADYGFSVVSKNDAETHLRLSSATPTPTPTATPTPDPIPIIADVESLVITTGEAIAIVSFNNTGGDITSCSITPALPVGLSLSISDCSITGTATVAQILTPYTITATNATGSDTASISIKVNTALVTLSGKITYDFIPFTSGGTAGLDYSNSIQKDVRGAKVQVIEANGTILGTTLTDENGNYTLDVVGSSVKVRVSAQLYKEVSTGLSSWDFQVKDNTNANALYVMEGALASLGTGSTQTRNLNASSGWGGSSYISTRTAGAFAILDVVYQGIQKVTIAQNDAVFPALDIFWSVNNLAASGDKALGQIGTSHFDGTALYILGKADSDTDEYDTAVVGHEWGHYYEAKFSRSDSIGGSHGGGDMLDIRVAFGEGFGTALGCMITDSQYYLDSLGTAQSQTGVYANLEAGGSVTNAGWYNESSIYNVLYDIFDSNDDAGDTLSLGFSAIHNVFINAQKNTDAFTSIFTFITALKAENEGNDAAIDAILENESIAPIADIYGTGRTNRASENANPLYHDLAVGSPLLITSNYTATSTTNYNKLGTFNYAKFTISTTGSYRFDISASNANSDPDLKIFKGASFIGDALAEGTTDTVTLTLSPGIYRISISDYAKVANSILTLTLTAE
jgi:hypothetical protein